MLILYGPDHFQKCALQDYSNLHIEQSLNGVSQSSELPLPQLHFEYPEGSSNSQDIVPEGYVKYVSDDGLDNNEFVIKERNRKDDGSGLIWIEFVCDLNVEPLKGMTIDLFDPGNVPPDQAINAALAGTGWSVGWCNITQSRHPQKANCTVFEAIQEVINIHMAEVQFDSINKLIHVYKQLGSDKGAYFSEQINLKSLQIQSSSRDYITRLKPIGANGLSIASVNPTGLPYVENYQYTAKPITAYWIDNRYTVAQDMYDDAVKRLDFLSKPKVAYSASIIDLARVSSKSVTNPFTRRNLAKQSTLQAPNFSAALANYVWACINSASYVGVTEEGLNYTTPADSGCINNSWGISINSAALGLKVGDTLAFSCDIKGTFGSSNNGLEVTHATTDNNAFYAAIVHGPSHPISISDWTRVSIVYTIPSNIRISTDGSFYLYWFWGGGFGSAANVYVRNLKIEKGTEATDWIPAPEDALSSGANNNSDNKYSVLDFSLGDTITLMSESNDVQEKQRITKIDRYLEEPEKSTCEIANRIASLDDIVYKLSTTAQTVDNVTTSAGDILGNKVIFPLEDNYGAPTKYLHIGDDLTLAFGRINGEGLLAGFGTGFFKIYACDVGDPSRFILMYGYKVSGQVPSFWTIANNALSFAVANQYGTVALRSNDGSRNLYIRQVAVCIHDIFS